MPKSCTVQAPSGSKNPVMEPEMEFTWVKVPMPNRPTHTPKKAKSFASQRQFLPMPRSM